MSSNPAHAPRGWDPAHAPRGWEGPPRRTPRLNHVAMSVPADALDEKGRADIVAFYNDVFGWEEYGMLTKDRERLVLRVYTNEQFVFLIADEPHMTCPRMDHFGMSVGSLDELAEIEARAKAWIGRDDRVEVSGRNVDDYGALALHSVYIRFLLPLQVEVQHYAYSAEAPPGS